MYLRFCLAAMMWMLPGIGFSLTDQSYDLRAILENGSLSQKDCDRYHAGDKSRETTLRCGKFMYFYDGLDTPGFPKGLVDLIQKEAPNTVGKGFENWGFIPDPYSRTNVPVGFAPGAKMALGVPTYSPSCATCHFAKLPDGKYVVGQANHDLEFSKLVLTLATLPELVLQPTKIQPAQVEELGSLRDEFVGSGWSKLALVAQALKLLPDVFIKGTKPLSDDEKYLLALNRPGTFDLFINSVEDGALVPLKILPLWELHVYGPRISTIGGTPDLTHVMRASLNVAVAMGGKLSAKYTDEYMVPLIEYIKQLQRPASPLPIYPEHIAAGKAVFEQNCASCHNGEGYSGTELFDIAEIGSDKNIINILDGNEDGIATKNIINPYELTRKIRAPRLEGIWSAKRLLHNGTLNSLEEVFCLSPRPKTKVLDVGLYTGGHEFGCDLPKNEREQLVMFLRSL